MALLILVITGTLSSGCSYLTEAAYKSADAAEAYCENNTELGRQAIRDTLKPAFVEKDMALGLRCPGEESMRVIGDPKVMVTE
jgi:hypothetical protein